MSHVGKPRCPHCARKLNKGAGNFCAHCGTSPYQVNKSVIFETDPAERERLLNAELMPVLEKSDTPAVPMIPEEAEAAWDRILGPLPHSRTPGGARPNLWDYAQKSAPAELDPIEVEGAWDDILAPSRIRNEWELDDERARFAAFVGQLAQAIRDRPAAKAASEPADRRWTELSRADKAALLPPRNGQAGN